ncbi:hypothetical protein QWY86_16145 [Pedobacter aquatilis]|uniref:hypothetical protein n=1 Tax=Pedobacter aquatilis TaxID=351343 RepID=UPI0025B30390|nr:hypothetical protein [Pedobacter aquatilis]MDN3588216.1 hypothetical protein [Pedobacter aquatilis]
MGNVVVSHNGSHLVITGNVIVGPDGKHSGIQENILTSSDQTHKILPILSEVKENPPSKSFFTSEKVSGTAFSRLLERVLGDAISKEAPGRYQAGNNTSRLK